jgi:5-formyltetrahydrofolate cyclo-ligase
MRSESAPDKRELRQKLRATLKEIPEAEVRAASVHACELLRQQSVWKNAEAVLFYVPLPGEVDLSPLLEAGLREGKTIAVPQFVKGTGLYDACQIRELTSDCSPGQFGISEPGAHCARFPLNRLDLALVPGVGFDAAGHRLGRGRGFFDRLLVQIRGIKCGVAFDQQIVERIPAEGHDVRMNFILTPTRWLKISE